MKYIKNKGLLVAVVALALLTILSSCKKDFFDIEDPQGIDSEIWNDEGAIGLFLNRTYSLVMPQTPTLGGIHNTSDELNNANTAFLYGTLNENSVTDMGTGNTITTNRYFDIRRCNLAIEGIDTSKALAGDVKGQLKAQFYFLRAFTYFKMVTLYGGVPLVLKAQEITNEGIVSTPRSKTSECIAAIVKDLDSAAVFLPANWPGPVTSADYGKVTRGAAKALKGKVLMYWASAQFNPTNIASRWEDAYQANLDAYNQCVTDGRILIPKYSDIFITEDHKEVLLVRKYTTTRDFGTNIENITRPFSESTAGSGSNQPTWNLVQSYLMKDGLPASASSASFPYNATLFWQNRDPRFDASIAYNGGFWPLSGNAVRKQWAYNGVVEETAGSIITGFYCKRFCNPTISAGQAIYNSNTGGGSGMDWIEMRFAEVIMNLAECANETGRLIEAKNMVRLIRTRAGIVVGGSDYGLSIATDMTTMRSLILKERQIEFALEGKRYFDLRRTRNLNLITARQSYKLSAKAPYYPGITRTGALPTDIFLDKPDAQGVRPKDTANLNNLVVHNAIFAAPAIASLEGSNVISIPSNYYFYALPNFFSQNTFVIEQTQGWINGTFDPLQ
jgi:starch-binding outer membrane protein, SusD/RagB family